MRQLTLLLSLVGLAACVIDEGTGPDATLITDVDRIDDSIYALASGSGSRQGTGGMITKIEAAHVFLRLTNRRRCRRVQSGGRAYFLSGWLPLRQAGETKHSARGVLGLVEYSTECAGQTAGCGCLVLKQFAQQWADQGILD